MRAIRPNMSISQYQPDAQDVTMNSKSVVRHDAEFFLKFFCGLIMLT